MPRLSIVIPSLTFDSLTEETLVSVLQNRPEYSEILVVTSETYADPYELGREVRFLTHASPGNVLDRCNYAGQQARGDILHFLAPGTIVLDGWTDHVWQHFQQSKVGAVSPVVLDATNPSRVAAAAVYYHSRGERRVLGAGARADAVAGLVAKPKQLAGLAPSSAAAFYLREAFVALSGFATDAGELFADVEMGLSLEELGYECVLEPTSLVTVSRSLARSPSSLAEVRKAEQLYRRQHGGTQASPTAHAMLVAKECLANFPGTGMINALLGRLGGAKAADLRAAQAERIEHARHELERVAEEVATIPMTGRGTSSIRQRLVQQARRRAA